MGLSPGWLPWGVGVLGVLGVLGGGSRMWPRARPLTNRGSSTPSVDPPFQAAAALDGREVTVTMTRPTFLQGQPVNIESTGCVLYLTLTGGR